MKLDSDASDGEDVNDDGELDDDDELDYGVLHDAGEDIAGRGRVLSAWALRMLSAKLSTPALAKMLTVSTHGNRHARHARHVRRDSKEGEVMSTIRWRRPSCMYRIRLPKP